jgi:serine/threonine-protein kinase
VRVDNQLLMLMEFVEGVTLDQKLKDGPLPANEAVNYVMQVLAALDYAHARGVVHRDIKPGNMMLTSGGVVKLMDFGIARSATDHKLTQTGTTVGSLYYMSPEQIQGVTAPDARSDLYSVGVSLYELVTGRKPFDGDSQFAIMSAHLAGTPVPPVTVDPRLPKMLNDVILMSVAKEAGARFQTAGALRNALANVAAGLQPTVALPPPAKAAPQPAKAAVPEKPVSHRGAWMGLGAVVAVLAIVAVIALAPWKKTGAAPAKADAPVAQPAPQLPVSEPSAPVATQPEPQPQQPAAAASSPVSTPGNASPRVPSRTPGMARSAPASSHSAGQAQQPMQQQPAPQQAVQEQPVQHQPAAPAGPSRAELQEVRESLALIGVRASGIRTSLQSLQRTQAASGMNLRGDMQAAANLMDTYLDGAQAALNARDVEQAKIFLDKAEPQVQKLEKFLNR